VITVPGPSPKHPAQRRRRNKPSTATTLVATRSSLPAPVLPERTTTDLETGEVTVIEWHPAATEYFTAVQESPMASEYVRVDYSLMLITAELIHDFHTGRSGMTKKELASEIRLQMKEQGQTAMGRRSLQFAIEQADEATDKGDRRRASRSGGSNDPRQRVIDVETVEED
jgi:hypothetical protein